MAGLESLERAQAEALAESTPQYFRDASIRGWPPRATAVVKWSQPEPGRQSVRAMSVGGAYVCGWSRRSDLSPLEESKRP